MSAVHDQATRLIKTTFGEGTNVTGFSHVSGDASGRQYFRAHIEGAALKSVLAMVPNEGFGPVVHWDKPLPQRDTFVILAGFFKTAGIVVPQIVCDARAENMVLVQDLGDCTLWKIPFGKLDESERKLTQKLGSNPVVTAYKKAVDIIAKFQLIKGEKGKLPFCRSLGAKEYQTESRRFIDLCLVPKGYPTGSLAVIEELIEGIVAKIVAHPTTLCHRDFMSWNLVLTEPGELGVLDFQDAVMASSSYDLISLLNDRDTDLALGKENYSELYRYGRDSLKLDLESYLVALTQRDLRLAGQFWNLANKLSKPHYNQFIPGCLRRLGSSLAALGWYDPALSQLCDYFPEIKAGAKAPWVL